MPWRTSQPILVREKEACMLSIAHSVHREDADREGAIDFCHIVQRFLVALTAIYSTLH